VYSNLSILPGDSLHHFIRESPLAGSRTVVYGKLQAVELTNNTDANTLASLQTCLPISIPSWQHSKNNFSSSNNCQGRKLKCVQSYSHFKVSAIFCQSCFTKILDQLQQDKCGLKTKQNLICIQTMAPIFI